MHEQLHIPVTGVTGALLGKVHSRVIGEVISGHLV